MYFKKCSRQDMEVIFVYEKTVLEYLDQEKRDLLQKTVKRWKQHSKQSLEKFFEGAKVLEARVVKLYLENDLDPFIAGFCPHYLKPVEDVAVIVRDKDNPDRMICENLQYYSSKVIKKYEKQKAKE